MVDWVQIFISCVTIACIDYAALVGMYVFIIGTNSDDCRLLLYQSLYLRITDYAKIGEVFDFDISGLGVLV